MCRINPRVDFAFKKLFGSEENKDLLISLINAIVTEEDTVEDVELKNPYNLADYQAGKMSILDIKAKNKKTGKWYNIEMQVGEDLYFDKRAIYYWSKLVTEQLSEGMMFKELKKAISINILGFNFIDDAHYHSRYRIMNSSTKKDDKLHNIFELHYIELRKFSKDFSEITDALDRWITFLTRAHELDKKRLPKEIESDTAIKKAIEAVDRMFDEEERGIYEVRLQAQAEVESRVASALEKGLAEGRAEGRAEGEHLAKIEIAKNLLDILDDETISKKTGLSADDIKKLRQ